MMRNSILQKSAAFMVAGALTLGAAAPGFAAPVPSSVAAIGKLERATVIDVRWRGRGGHWRGGGIAAGIAAGLIGGAFLANPYYYDDPYYYGPAPYAYGPGPVYVQPPVVYAQPRAVYAPAPGPNGPVRQCWVATDKDRGFGYWQPC